MNRAKPSKYTVDTKKIIWKDEERQVIESKKNEQGWNINYSGDFGQLNFFWKSP